MQVTVRITGNSEEIARFRKLGDKLTDFTAAMKDVGSELKTYYGGVVFKTEGGAIGERWTALSPVYKKRKGKLFPGVGTLVATGKLSKSFQAATTKNSATISNNRTTKNGRNLLEIHQLGLGKNPVRPIMVVNQDVQDIVERIIDKDVKKKLASVS